MELFLILSSALPYSASLIDWPIPCLIHTDTSFDLDHILKNPDERSRGCASSQWMQNFQVVTHFYIVRKIAIHHSIGYAKTIVIVGPSVN